MKVLLLLVGILISTLVNAQYNIDVGAEYDNTIFSDQTDNSDGQGTNLRSGRTCNLSERRALLLFPLQMSIPANATITDARLDLYFISGGDSVGTSDDYSIFAMSEPWGEAGSMAMSGAGAPADQGDATWNSPYHGAAAWNIAGGTFQTTPIATSSLDSTAGIYSWSSTDLTNLVQTWVDNFNSNYGLILIADDTIPCSARKFGSGESNNPPILHVEFECYDSLGCVLDIAPIAMPQLAVYPNPANQELNIIAENGNQIEFYNLQGQLVLSQPFNQNEETLDVSNLDNGTYVLRVMTATGITSREIIIQH